MTFDAPVLAAGEAGCVWVQSDLQLAKPETAARVLTHAVDDMLSLNLGVAGVWCLGDALCGANQEALEEVARVSVEQLERLGVPVCYVMGNHEMDLRNKGVNRYPLYERASQHPSWHTMTTLDGLFFARTYFGTLCVFTGDHADPAGKWWTAHGTVGGEAEGYPHTPEMFAQLRDAIARHPGPVITISHYAYPGGQRPSAAMGRLLPLPANVALHLHGHAHIGDMVWNKERPYQRENPVDGHVLKQFNISALETERSAGSHSALLEFGPAGPTRLRIRCHLERAWVESFDLTPVMVEVR